MLLVYITLNLGALGWVIYSALRKVDDSVVFNCERSDGDDMLVKQFCEKGFNFVKGLPIAFMTVALFVQICEYPRQLQRSEPHALHRCVRHCAQFLQRP